MTTTFPGTATSHGTLAGYSLHKKRGEDPCVDCKKARSDYDAKRTRTEKVAEVRRIASKAQSRALLRLARAHHEEYARLYVEEKARIDSEKAEA